MASTTGLAADPAALATAVNDFLTVNGWTANRFDAQGTGQRLELQRTYVQGTATLTMTVGLRFSNAENPTPFSPGTGTYVLAVPGSSYSSGADWHSQTGSPLAANGTTRIGAGSRHASTNITYYLFTSADEEHVVLVWSQASTVFNYLIWGTALTKFGTWTGGVYLMGSRGAPNVMTTTNRADGVTLPPLPPGYHVTAAAGDGSALVRVDEGGFGEEWRAICLANQATSARTTRVLHGFSTSDSAMVLNTSSNNSNLMQAAGGHLWVRSRSALTNNVLLFPCIILTERTALGLNSMIGYPPSVRAGFIRGSLNNGNDITIGADTWTVFDGWAVKKEA